MSLTKKAKAEMKLVTLEEAVELIKDTLMKKYNNPKIVERLSRAPGTLYNMRSDGRLTRYGTPKLALFDVNELLELCG
jgi:hypothetical protein